MACASAARMSKLRESLVGETGVALFVGAVSRAVADAVIEASKTGAAIGLLASRNQIETSILGGGYCNGWTTESFVSYVRSRDESDRVVIQRDHGGPWQGSGREQELPTEEALTRARTSLVTDIESGVDAIHVDPCRDSGGRFSSVSDFLTRTVELAEFCAESALRLKRELPALEIGTDEGNVGTLGSEELERLLGSILAALRDSANSAAFVVIPTKARIRGLSNNGLLPLADHRARLFRFAAKHRLLVKLHSTDYLSDSELRWIGRNVTGAINIAPQLGVAETRVILDTVNLLGLTDLSRRFVFLADRRGGWARWARPDSNCTDREKALLGGHYIFSTQEGATLLEEMQSACSSKGVNLQAETKAAIRREIDRQVRLLSESRKS